MVVSLQDVRHWQRRRGGAHRLPQTVPFAPAQQDAWGTPSSAHWVLGGSHLSSSEGSTAMRGQRPKVARLWGRGWGCPQPLVAQLDKGGQAVGIRHFNPLALTSHLHWLSWAGGRVGGGPPFPGFGGWTLQTTPFLGKLWVSPLRLPQAPSSKSAFLTVCAMWIPPRGCGASRQDVVGVGWGVGVASYAAGWGWGAIA